MRKTTCQVLLATVLVLLSCSTRGISPDNCLHLDEQNSCTCCRSGYRGQTCNDYCRNCLSRFSSQHGCMYYCSPGFYNTRCNVPCPRTCAHGSYGKPACHDRDGVLTCVSGCIAGFYGTQCDSPCTYNCLNKRCYKDSGKCLQCNDRYHHGGYCNITCNRGCKYEMCLMSGKCSHGCKHGYYGVDCRSKCGSNCVDRLCVSDMNHVYMCTQGCQAGYRGVNCSEKCPTDADGCNLQPTDLRESVKDLASKRLTVVKSVDSIIAGIGFVVVVVVVVVAVVVFGSVTIRYIYGLRSHNDVTEGNTPLVAGTRSDNANHADEETSRGHSDQKKGFKGSHSEATEENTPLVAGTRSDNTKHADEETSRGQSDQKKGFKGSHSEATEENIPLVAGTWSDDANHADEETSRGHSDQKKGFKGSHNEVAEENPPLVAETRF